jgi:leader peptidase (prepilin peptidase)/N-methyltransferase
MLPDFFPEPVFLPFLFIFGTAIGSFLNVLIDRLPNERSIMGRSHCDHCKHVLNWYDLFPLVSFILLKGKCRYCNNKIPSVIPLIELITGVSFVFIWLFLGTAILEKVSYMVFIAGVIVVFFADAKYKIIPDSMHIVLIAATTGLHLFRESSPPGLLDGLIAGVVVALPLLFLNLITKGKGMGFGDVKLGFVIGYTFGILGGFLVLYIGFVTGAVAGVFLIMMHRTKLKQTIAFGPFLVLGMIVMLFWGEYIIGLMKRIYSF